VLLGSAGHDLLVGGFTADRISGRHVGDSHAGTTALDQAAAHDDALVALMKEWTDSGSPSARGSEMGTGQAGGSRLHSAAQAAVAEAEGLWTDQGLAAFLCDNAALDGLAGALAEGTTSEAGDASDG
jgi:hypothetical protein